MTAAGALVTTSEGTSSGHIALIHDVALNQTGRRMASCGTDRSIMIWDLVDVDGVQKFALAGRIPNSHTASVTKLSWANNTYGQMLVSCGLDKQIRLWQELPSGGEKSWKVLWNTPVERGVTDVKFAPRQFGLKIAHGSLEGGIQTWVASGSNFGQWSKEGQFEPTQTEPINRRLGVTCLDWNPSTLEETEMLVIGTDCGIVQILELSGQTGRDRWQPMPLATATAPTPTPPVGDPMAHASAVVDVAWAPPIGRRYHLIASCSKDGTLMIHKLYDSKAEMTPTAPRTLRVVRVFHGAGIHNNNNIWRVSWNLTGTTVASSGDDGYIMLWQQTRERDEATNEFKWDRIKTLQPTLPSELAQCA